MEKMLATMKKCGEDILVFFFAIPVFIRQFVESFDEKKREETKETIRKMLPGIAGAAAVIVLIVIIAKCCKAAKAKAQKKA